MQITTAERISYGLLQGTWQYCRAQQQRGSATASFKGLGNIAEHNSREDQLRPPSRDLAILQSTTAERISYGLLQGTRQYCRAHQQRGSAMASFKGLDNIAEHNSREDQLRPPSRDLAILPSTTAEKISYGLLQGTWQYCRAQQQRGSAMPPSRDLTILQSTTAERNSTNQTDELSASHSLWYKSST